MPMEGLTCDACGHYPLVAEHAHYICPQCGYKTKCCEGGVCRDLPVILPAYEVRNCSFVISLIIHLKP